MRTHLHHSGPHEHVSEKKGRLKTFNRHFYEGKHCFRFTKRMLSFTGGKKSDASQTVTVKLICSVYGTFTKLLLTHIYSNTKMRLYLKGYLHVEVLIKHTLRWY